jgi:uncharacterized protein
VANFEAPGVYSSINSSGKKPIESVGASTGAFIGQSSKGVTNKAMLITNFAQFQKEFGGIEEAGNLAHGVYGYFQNGGGRCFVCNVGAPEENQTENDLAALVKGNDGGPDKRSGLHVFKSIEDISMVACPGGTSEIIHQTLADFCGQMNDRIAVLDGVQELGDIQLNEFPRIGDQSNAALYWPWIQVFDETTKQKVMVPPSGHVMGLVARVDAERGVHKAPANEVLRGALGLRYTLTREEQALLNPRGINLIRDLGDQGIRVYGARTLSTDPEWKYLNVRRLFQVVQQSVVKGTDWVVFEPNSQGLWGDVERNIKAYLKTLFNTGALAGNTPEEAFYVNCNEGNNPQENIDNGILTVDIGIAPVKPAEFVKINIQQHMEENQ